MEIQEWVKTVFPVLFLSFFHADTVDFVTIDTFNWISGAFCCAVCYTNLNGVHAETFAVYCQACHSDLHTCIPHGGNAILLFTCMLGLYMYANQGQYGLNI